MSVISAFVAIYAFGFTLNTMTLMALSLSIGILIDDAIVVRENIVRHVEPGEDHHTAARRGTSEIGFAVLATTFSVVAVVVPVAFLMGIVGRFCFPFGIVIAGAVLVSLFVSFTLDPMRSFVPLATMGIALAASVGVPVDAVGGPMAPIQLTLQGPESPGSSSCRTAPSRRCTTCRGGGAALEPRRPEARAGRGREPRPRGRRQRSARGRSSAPRWRTP